MPRYYSTASIRRYLFGLILLLTLSGCSSTPEPEVIVPDTILNLHIKADYDINSEINEPAAPLQVRLYDRHSPPNLTFS